MIEEAYRTGVLDPRVHRRIVGDIQRYAERAGVPPEAICRALDEYVGEDETAWVRRFLLQRAAPLPGLAYVGRCRDVSERMVGIAGCMVRNFVDARVMTAARVVDERPRCTILLIPNFFIGRTSSQGWSGGALVDVLAERLTGGKSTVIYVSDLEVMKDTYGEAAFDLVNRLQEAGR